MKKFTGIMTALMVAVLLAGCGQDATAESGEDSGKSESGVTTESTEGTAALQTPLSQLDVPGMVTLGDYKNIELTFDPVTVSDEELNALMSEVYIESLSAEVGGITDRAVENGDTVIIDYEGKRDGVAFDGGTAQGASLEIGSGSFIAGFEEGLVGVMPGDTVDLELSFPESYWNEELAGVPVVFTVTVQCIIPASVTYEDMQDEVVATMGINDVNTVEEFKQFAYEYLYQYAQSNRDYDIQDGILESLVNCCTYHDLPEGLLEAYGEKIRQNIERAAETNGVSAEYYSSYMYSMSVQEVVDEYAEKTMHQELAMQAVAIAEGLTVSDEDLEAQLLEYAQAAGYSEVDEILNGISREEYRNYFMSENVLAYLTEQTTIIEK